MKEITDYLKKEKKDFAKGLELYDKFGKGLVPDFDKFNNFFNNVDKDNEEAAKGILIARLEYINRIYAQNAPKKKNTAEPTIKVKEDPNKDKKKGKK